MWKNFDSMPKLLKFLTAHAMFCIAFLICSVIPQSGFSINGNEVTFSQWWSSGAGVFASLLGIAGPLVAYGFLTKSRHSRPAYAGFLMLAFVLTPIFMRMDPIYIPVGVLVVVLGVVCLYKLPSMRMYFTPGSTTN